MKKILILLILILSNCSDPDIYYKVTITSIEKNKQAYYYIYKIKSLSEPPYPTSYFLEVEGKYMVGDTIILKR